MPSIDSENLARAWTTSSSRGRLDRLRMSSAPAAERVGQRQQDAQDLFVLLLLERDDVVVDLDRAERLEKEARAARRRCRGRCPECALRCSAFTTRT